MERLHSAFAFRSLGLREDATFRRLMVPFLMWSLIRANLSSRDLVDVFFDHSLVHREMEPAESSAWATLLLPQFSCGQFVWQLWPKRLFRCHSDCRAA